MKTANDKSSAVSKAASKSVGTSCGCGGSEAAKLHEEVRDAERAPVRARPGGAGIVDCKVARLIATAASIAANNDQGFTEAVTSLKAAGAHEDEIRFAVSIGQFVKEKPAGIMKNLADQLAGTHLVGDDPPGECPAAKLKGTTSYRVTLLIAAGSAMAASCEPCLNKVIPDLIEAKACDEDIRRALEIGQFVKDQKGAVMKEAADILAGTNLLEEPAADPFHATDGIAWSRCA